MSLFARLFRMGESDYPWDNQYGKEMIFSF